MDQQKYKSKDRFHWQNGLTVEVQNGDLERALKKLKKKLQNEGVFQELKKRECYIKPSERKRRALAQAIARNRKRNRQEDQSTRLDKPDHND